MVLSLTNLCLLCIQEALENGLLHTGLSYVPPDLRKLILEMVMARGNVYKGFLYGLFTSSEFFDGITSLNFQRGVNFDRHGSFNPEMVASADDHVFLDRLTVTLAQTMGQGISELKLNVYNEEIKGQNLRFQPNLQSIARLIGECPNLKKLDLRYVDTSSPESTLTASSENADSLITIFGAVVQSLTELSIIGKCCRSTPFLASSDLDKIDFKNLTSLILVDQSVECKAWEQILRSASGSLVSLDLRKISFIGPNDNEYQILPIPLPNLKRLKLNFPTQNRPSESFVENLIHCPNLESVQLKTEMYEYKPYFTKLADSTFDLELVLRSTFWFDMNLEYLLENLGQWINAFGSKITGFHWTLGPNVDDELFQVLKPIMDGCSNLKSFKTMYMSMGMGMGLITDRPQMTPTFSILFRDPERAKNLRRLKFFGEVDYGVLMSLFENCIDLESLRVSACPQLENQHLIEWANRGGGRNLRKLHIYRCANCNCDATIPVLMNCGDSLISFGFRSRMPREVQQRAASRVWPILIERCRYVTDVDMPSQWLEMARSKCFLRKLRWMNVH